MAQASLTSPSISVPSIFFNVGMILGEERVTFRGDNVFRMRVRLERSVISLDY